MSLIRVICFWISFCISIKSVVQIYSESDLQQVSEQNMRILTGNPYTYTTLREYENHLKEALLNYTTTGKSPKVFNLYLDKRVADALSTNVQNISTVHQWMTILYKIFSNTVHQCDPKYHSKLFHDKINECRMASSCMIEKVCSIFCIIVSNYYS